MNIRPDTWTHHHTHRLFHISQLAGFAFIIAALISGAFSVWSASRATDIVSSGTVNLTAQVGIINPGPTATGGIRPTQPPSSIPTPTQPRITISTIPAHLSQRNMLPVFPGARPAFEGTTNIPNALILLTINTPVAIHGLTASDTSGRWSWQSPIDVANGKYAIVATARSQSDGALAASTRLEFYVDAGMGAGQRPPHAETEARKPVGLHLLLEIPEQFKTIAPGDEFVARLTIVNVDNNPIQGTLHFRIENAHHEVVMRSEESFTVERGLTVLTKSFVTSPLLGNGDYSLFAEISDDTWIAPSSDTFRAEGKRIVILSSTTKTDLTALLEFLAALLLLFSIIAYFELKKILIHSEHIRRLSPAAT